MKTTITALFLLLAVALAADEPRSQETTQMVGFAAGRATGAGLSYRLWPAEVGLQVTALPMYSQDNENLGVSVALLRTVRDYQWSRFFLYTSALGLFSSLGKTPGWGFTVGTGFGLEFVAFDHLCLDLQAGVQGSTGSVDSNAGLTGEIGLFYRL